MKNLLKISACGLIMFSLASCGSQEGIAKNNSDDGVYASRGTDASAPAAATPAASNNTAAPVATNTGSNNQQQNNNYQSANSTSDRGTKKGKKEKKSDWICPRCDNLNYSFRKFCNRCQILR